MKTFDDINQLELDFPALSNWLRKNCYDPANGAAISNTIGGVAHIIDTHEEVINLAGMTADGRVSNLAQDIVTADLDEKIDDEWAVWALITNDAGGDVYFVPTRIRKQYTSYGDAPHPETPQDDVPGPAQSGDTD